MKTYLESRLARALQALGCDAPAEGIKFERPRLEAHGDLSTNIALSLARQLKRNPREIATQLIGKLDLDPRIVTAEPAGAGFINFRFHDDYIVEQLATILEQGARFGRTATGAGRSANVEWVSANPTGPLHAGHGRQVCVGETLSALLEWSGWRVTREYYFNNAGNQMNNLGRSVFLRYRQALGEDVPFEEGLYNGDYIRDIAASIVAQYGDSKREAELSFFRKFGEEQCFAMIRATLERLKVRHDVFFNEDSLYREGKIAEVIAELRDRNLAYDKDGAVWFRATGLGLDQDRVIVKSSGEPTYRLPDIAYHRDKILRGYDLVVDIFGADHIATIPDVLAGVRALGHPVENVKVIIHQMVSFVNEGESMKMSKRSANVYSLDDLIDDVGQDAVRYFFVMRSVHSHLEFDLRLAREQSENNPVYYLQYAHARIAGIIRFAREEGIDVDAPAELPLLREKPEVDLVKALLEFPAVVDSAAQSFEPHRLCIYLQETATSFHKFYHECRVVTENAPLTAARIALCRATIQVIANGLSILGIAAPERM